MKPAGNPSTAGDLTDLVADARRGDASAWTRILERYLPLIRAIARGCRLNEQDVEDVGQTVCLRLVEHLGRIREPEALPGWIATTARHESLRLIRDRGRTVPIDPAGDSILETVTDSRGQLDADLVRAEEAQVLRAGLDQLPLTRRDLLLMLFDDQPLSYREISARLAIPIGSIGPTRARILARLRESPPLRDYLDATDPRPHHEAAA